MTAPIRLRRTAVPVAAIPENDDLTALRALLTDVETEIAGLETELAGVRSAFQEAAASRDFAGQIETTAAASGLPVKLATARCRRFGLIAQIARLEADLLQPAMVPAKEAREAAELAHAEATEALRVAGMVLYRTQSRLAALRSKAKEADDRAAQIAGEMTAQTSRDARAILSAA